MRVLIAPDSFTGSLTAAQAASAIAAGWHRTAPGDACDLLPVSDGGPGFVAALATGLGGRLLTVPSVGPWGDPVIGEVLMVGSTGYVEIAQAAGAGSAGDGHPGAASSAGVAPLLRAVVDAGASRIVVGLGGSLTSDAGAGMLAALGATALSGRGEDVTALLLGGGAGLLDVAAVDLSGPRAMFAEIDLVIASDVDVPLLGPRGAARGFGPQKGVGPALVEELEASHRQLAHACGRRPDGKSPAVALGAGAAGGLGFALLHLGGVRASGIDEVLAAVGFAERVAQADLVITGEGSFDWQSLNGKAIEGICGAAMSTGRPVLVLAGQISVGRREWMAVGVSGAYAIHDPADPADDVADAIAHGAQRLADIAARAARTWSR